MTREEQWFIEGFVKRAQDYGLAADQFTQDDKPTEKLMPFLDFMDKVREYQNQVGDVPKPLSNRVFDTAKLLGQGAYKLPGRAYDWYKDQTDKAASRLVKTWTGIDPTKPVYSMLPTFSSDSKNSGNFLEQPGAPTHDPNKNFVKHFMEFNKNKENAKSYADELRAAQKFFSEVSGMPLKDAPTALTTY
jgi:hypothetical protein